MDRRAFTKVVSASVALPAVGSSLLCNPRDLKPSVAENYLTPSLGFQSAQRAMEQAFRELGEVIRPLSTRDRDEWHKQYEVCLAKYGFTEKYSFVLTEQEQTVLDEFRSIERAVMLRAGDQKPFSRVRVPLVPRQRRLFLFTDEAIYYWKLLLPSHWTRSYFRSKELFYPGEYDSPPTELFVDNLDTPIKLERKRHPDSWSREFPSRVLKSPTIETYRISYRGEGSEFQDEEMRFIDQLRRRYHHSVVVTDRPTPQQILPCARALAASIDNRIALPKSLVRLLMFAQGPSTSSTVLHVTLPLWQGDHKQFGSCEGCVCVIPPWTREIVVQEESHFLLYPLAQQFDPEWVRNKADTIIAEDCLCLSRPVQGTGVAGKGAKFGSSQKFERRDFRDIPISDLQQYYV